MKKTTENMKESENIDLSETHFCVQQIFIAIRMCIHVFATISCGTDAESTSIHNMSERVRTRFTIYHKVRHKTIHGT